MIKYMFTQSWRKTQNSVFVFSFLEIQHLSVK